MSSRYILSTPHPQGPGFFYGYISLGAELDMIVMSFHRAYKRLLSLP